MQIDMKTHEKLVANLLKQLGGKEETELIQTHISTIILSGDTAYKLKKPVDFGFLDYSTLERRHRFCLDELRINRRFAEKLYLGVVPVTGSADSAQIGGEGEVVDYAVKMRRFDQDGQLDNVAQRGALECGMAKTMATLIADSHERSIPADPATDFGEPERVVAPMQENFALLGRLEGDKRVTLVKAWTDEQFKRLTPLIKRRKQEGFIRECHGDMHLHNMAFFEDELIMFDAIEFNPYLSHIDVISDLSFVLMDLEYRGLVCHSRRLLNRYLELTGDYEGLRLLDFYKTYRAMVRAKVALLKAEQELTLQAHREEMEEVSRYIDLALDYTRGRKGSLVITHGFSGSGKSSCALMMVERFGAVRIRSDVERMRMFGTKANTQRSEDIYRADATRATYGRLAELTREVVRAGYPAVVDATFLKFSQRRIFQEFALKAAVPFAIASMQCDLKEMRRRVEERSREGADVSEADLEVLEMQIRTTEPLSSDEAGVCIRVDCSTFESMRESAGQFIPPE